MAKISKGFAMTTAVIGTLAFLFGLAVSICAWTLSAKVSDFNISATTDDFNVKFKSYWWGGLFYVVPGIFGIAAGCSRNVVAMIFYMIFNILCLLSSVLVSIFVALAIVAWALIESLSKDGRCVDRSSLFYSKQCQCTDYNENTYNINNLTCSEVKSIQSILAAIIALSSISSLLAFIASYVSCCALCNQEPETHATVIVQPGVGSYQPPANVVISNTSHQHYAQQPQYYPQQPQYAQPPPQYSQPPPQQYVSTKDRAKLVKNEVI